MQEISTGELKNLMDSEKEFLLLDCRAREYFAKEHIPNATNLRWTDIENRAEEIIPDNDMLIITSCSGFTCSASTRCYERLEELGYKNLLEYSGGLSDWKAHGLPTVKQ